MFDRILKDALIAQINADIKQTRELCDSDANSMMLFTMDIIKYLRNKICQVIIKVYTYLV